LSGGSKFLTGLLRSILPSVVALLLGLAAGSVLMIVFGLNPITIFSQIFNGALGSQFGQSTVLNYMASYVLLAIAFLLPGKAGIWNVGGQGQATLGGIVAALVVVFLPLPPGLWALVAVVAACIVGGLWAAVSGLLEAYRNASAIVTTIMMNFVASAFATFLLLFAIVPKIPGAAIYDRVDIGSAATLPTLPYFNSSIMIVAAVLAAFGTALFLARTTLGYSIRATGLGATQAESKGINPRSMKVIAMILGGMLAGLAGAGDVLGVGHGCYLTACYVDGFAGGWFGGEGFAGIVVALVAANNPVGSIVSGLFFSILAAGTAAVYQNIYVVWAMQGIIVLFMAAPTLSASILNYRRKKKWI
jgi:simple sugar transport system permease protein